MSASEKLRGRLFGEGQYEALNVSEREAVVAVVEALQAVAADAHGPGYREKQHRFNGGPVEMHIPTLMQVDDALAALDEALS